MTNVTFTRIRGAVVEASVSDLPALTGSDRQVEWAGKIRDRALAHINVVPRSTVERAMLGGMSDDKIADGLARQAAMIAKALDVAVQASWWIDLDQSAEGATNPLTLAKRLGALLPAAQAK